MEAEEIVVGFVAGETRAMDTGLLTRAQADDLAVVGVGYGVGLGEFEGQSRDGEIAEGGVGEGRGVFGSDDGVEGFLGVDADVVSVLLELDAVDGAGFCGGRLVGRVHL